MAEIRCDSATLHAYYGQRRVTDPQLGEQRTFDGREQVALPLPGDQETYVYAWLWKDGEPLFATDPLLVRPGGTYDPGSVVTIDH
jgi:hypothetical protein